MRGDSGVAVAVAVAVAGCCHMLCYAGYFVGAADVASFVFGFRWSLILNLQLSLVAHTCVSACPLPHMRTHLLYRGSGAHSFPSVPARGGTRCVVAIVSQRPRGHLLTQQPRGARRGSLLQFVSLVKIRGCQLPLSVSKPQWVLVPRSSF